MAASKYCGVTAKRINLVTALGEEITKRRLMMPIPFNVREVPFGCEVRNDPGETAIGLAINDLVGALEEVKTAFYYLTGREYSFDTAEARISCQYLGADPGRSNRFTDAVRENWKQIRALNEEKG